jgi:hypothetical protein
MSWPFQNFTASPQCLRHGRRQLLQLRDRHRDKICTRVQPADVGADASSTHWFRTSAAIRLGGRSCADSIGDFSPRHFITCSINPAMAAKPVAAPSRVMAHNTRKSRSRSTDYLSLPTPPLGGNCRQSSIPEATRARAACLDARVVSGQRFGYLWPVNCISRNSIGQLVPG